MLKYVMALIFALSSAVFADEGEYPLQISETDPFFRPFIEIIKAKYGKVRIGQIVEHNSLFLDHNESKEFGRIINSAVNSDYLIALLESDAYRKRMRYEAVFEEDGRCHYAFGLSGFGISISLCEDAIIPFDAATEILEEDVLLGERSIPVTFIVMLTQNNEFRSVSTAPQYRLRFGEVTVQKMSKPRLFSSE